jgi:hypothetical protein
MKAVIALLSPSKNLWCMDAVEASVFARCSTTAKNRQIDWGSRC